MKLDKTLIKALVIGLAMGGATSCAKIDLNKEFEKEPETHTHTAECGDDCPAELTPEPGHNWDDCPACGLG